MGNLEQEQFIKNHVKLMKNQMDFMLGSLKKSFSKEEDIDPITGKLSEEHCENCSGCALCDPEEPAEDAYEEYKDQEVKSLNSK